MDSPAMEDAAARRRFAVLIPFQPQIWNRVTLVKQTDGSGLTGLGELTALAHVFKLLTMQFQELFLSIIEQPADGWRIGDTDGILDLNQLRHQDKGFHW
jgi:hypothetical protein